MSREGKELKERIEFLEKEVFSRGIKMRDIVDAYIIINKMEPDDLTIMATDMVNYIKSKQVQMIKYYESVKEYQGEAMELTNRMRQDGKLGKT